MKVTLNKDFIKKKLADMKVPNILHQTRLYRKSYHQPNKK